MPLNYTKQPSKGISPLHFTKSSGLNLAFPAMIDMTGIVAAAAASAAFPAVLIEVDPSAALSAAAPTSPNVGEGIVPSAMSAPSSAPTPAVSLEVTAVSATASASVPAPNFGEGIVPAAAAASASAPDLALTLELLASAAAASASAPAPDVAIDTSVNVAAVSAEASAQFPTPEISGADSSPVRGGGFYSYHQPQIYDDEQPVEVFAPAARSRAFMPTPNITVNPSQAEIDQMFADLSELLVLELV